ncbi:MAG: AEC family transporter [Butyricicoccus sp.]|nr:AEC family transporter [Butyricicoccus sp.]
MLQSLLFALDATLPIILIAVIGWGLRMRGFLTKEFLDVLNRLLYKIMLPLLLFRDVAAGRITQDFDVRFAGYCFFSTIAYFAVIWLLSELLIREKSIIGAFVQGSYRGSIALLGVAFLDSIYGNSGQMPLAIVSAVPLYNIFAVVLLTVRGDNGAIDPKALVRKCVKGILTNPILLGVFGGLLFSLFEIELPAVAAKTVNYFAVCCTPLALLVIGAEFEGRKALRKIRPTVAASLIKLLVLPAVLLPVAVWMGFRGQDMVVLLVLAGSPATATGYIMCKNLHGDYVLSSSIIMLTTALSAVTVTLLLFVLRSLALV